jgi:CheY-like chemotaxis protein
MHRTATLLLVEDNPILQEVVATVLTGAGHRVTTAASAEQAFAALEVFRFDLILTDALVAFSAGKIDYWRALDALAAHAGAARLVILTAHREREFHDFLRHGFAAILRKPCALDVLVAAVAAALVPRDETARV